MTVRGDDGVGVGVKVGFGMGGGAVEANTMCSARATKAQVVITDAHAHGGSSGSR
jgi:hypothetical protein